MLTLGFDSIFIIVDTLDGIFERGRLKVSDCLIIDVIVKGGQPTDLNGVSEFPTGMSPGPLGSDMNYDIATD